MKPAGGNDHGRATSGKTNGAPAARKGQRGSLLVVGSLAFDSIKTREGTFNDLLGGSAVYFALSAALFAPTRLVGVVGEDFPARHRTLLEDREVDLTGLSTLAGGRTFRWSGEYSADMNSRETLSVELNVLERFEPRLPDSFRESPYVFLANDDPLTQMKVLDQVRGNPFVMADTMDLWIRTRHAELERLLRRVDGLVINDSEAMLFTDETNLVVAGRRIRDYGLRYVVIKKGEHGALIFHDGGEIYLPATPLADVRDPTGAGDSFAGGIMGFIASTGRRDLEGLKLAVAWGTVVASFCCQGLGVARLETLTRGEVDERLDAYRGMLALPA